MGFVLPVEPRIATDDLTATDELLSWQMENMSDISLHKSVYGAGVMDINQMRAMADMTLRKLEGRDLTKVDDT